jgi:hypothetical protein
MRWSVGQQGGTRCIGFTSNCQKVILMSDNKHPDQFRLHDPIGRSLDATREELPLIAQFTLRTGDLKWFDAWLVQTVAIALEEFLELMPEPKTDEPYAQDVRQRVQSVIEKLQKASPGDDFLLNNEALSVVRQGFVELSEILDDLYIQ